MTFILDCSVTMAWLFLDEMNDYTESILDALQKNKRAIVPGLWTWEVSNVLLVGERRGRITHVQAIGFWEILKALPIIIDEQAVIHAHDTTYHLAHEHKISAYDAAYLEVALRQQAPLATMDKQLIKVAQAMGVHVL